MTTTEDLMQAVLNTASVNIKNNLEDAHVDLRDVADLADDYLEQYATCITRDILSVKDKDKLMGALRMQAIGNFYMFRVLSAYINQLEVIDEVESDESLNQILTD